MAVKLRVKVGSIELDYEGSEDWLKEGLPNLITNVSELQRLPGSMAGGFPPPENAGGKSSGQLPSNGTSDFQMSVENVSHKINAKEGTDLIRAAAAYLTLVERKNTFSRKELLDAMKSATSFYDSSAVKNLSYNLGKLQKAGHINERSKGVYALTATQRKSLEEQLAEA